LSTSSNATPAPLDDTHLKAFRRDGFLTVRGLFSVGEVSSLSQQVERVISLDRAPSEHYGSTFRSWRSVTNHSRVLADFSCDPRLVTPVMQYLGPRIRLMGSQLIHRDTLDGTEVSRIPGAHGWHRDIFGMDYDLHGDSPACAVKATVWLSSAEDARNGATLFVAGSHTESAMPRIEEGKADPEVYVQERPAIGDVTFFENRTFHAGGYNTSTQTLKFLIFQYGYRWLRPVAGQCHSDELLEGCSDFQKEILEPVEISPDNQYRPKAKLPVLDGWFRP
jgi:hypothetical protein